MEGLGNGNLRMIPVGDIRQISHFADYMVGWGAYVFFNMIMALLIGRGFWAETLFLPPMYVMSRWIGVWRSISVWVWGYAVMYGVFFLTRSMGITIASVVAIFFVLTLISYRIMIHLKGSVPSPALSNYIGIIWGLLWASAWLIISMFSESDKISNLLFIYAAGAALLITGILNRGFLILGLYTLMVVPVILKFFPSLFMPAYALIGLGMMIAGFLMGKNK